MITNCPSDVRTNNAIVTWSPDPTASDDDGTTPTVACNPVAGSSFPIDMSTTVVCNANDTVGNEANCTFIVIVGRYLLPYKVSRLVWIHTVVEST